MKKNSIKEAFDGIGLSESAKQRIKNSCYEALTENESKNKFTSKIGFRILCAVGAVLILSISAFAAARFIDFSMTKNEDGVTLHAALPEENKDTEAPLRAWNSDSEKGEVSIRLEFDYMPSDLKEDPIATHKYGGETGSRAITFVGHDLRRSDFNEIVKYVDEAEKFMAGDKEAYLLRWDSLVVYDKDIYVLFEKEEMLIHGMVGYGITVDEIKAIAEGMRIVEVEDINIALPISNEFGTDSDDSTPKVVYSDPIYVYRDDLLPIGEVGEYNGYFDQRTVRVDKIELLDNISGYEKDFIRSDVIEKFTGDSGEFIPYMRGTRVFEGDIEAGERPRIVLGEETEMKKRFILITLTVTEDEDDTDADIKAFLHTFSLGGLVETEEGHIERTQGWENFIINGAPETHADFHDPLYRKKIGGNKWVLGYFLDEDEIGEEMYLYSHLAKLYYSLELNVN